MSKQKSSARFRFTGAVLLLAALLFLVLGYGFYCIIPYLGIALEWVLQHI